MTIIGIIGSGHVGSNLAQAAIAHGYDVVLSPACRGAADPGGPLPVPGSRLPPGRRLPGPGWLSRHPRFQG